MKKLLISLAVILSLTCAVPTGATPDSIMDNLMTELSEVKTYKGDIKNHTSYIVDYAIMPIVNGKMLEPVITGHLISHEVQFLELEAGTYVLVAFAGKDGMLVGQWSCKFLIRDGLKGDYGFDIRGEPPTKIPKSYL